MSTVLYKFIDNNDNVYYASSTKTARNYFKKQKDITSVQPEGARWIDPYKLERTDTKGIYKESK